MLLRVERFFAIDHIENELYLVGDEQCLDEMERRIAAITPQTADRWNQLTPVARYNIVSRPDYLKKVVEECLSLIEAR